MRITSAAIAFALIAGAPAAASDLIHQIPFYAEPRPVASLKIASRRVEMLAVTQRARADTPRRRAHLNECRNMAKVIPGYPQPAFVTVDFRVQF